MVHRPRGSRAWLRTTTAVVATVVLAACGGSGGDDRDDEQVSVAEARSALQVAQAPEDGTFDAGTFRFSRAFDAGSAPEDGRLASYSWDIAYHLDSGGLGSWSAGLDVFDAPDAALESARKVSGRWPCKGEPVPIDDLAGDHVDYLDASYCKKLSAEGFVAQLSTADGPVTVNLTVGGTSPESTSAALAAVWGSLSDVTRAASASLD